MRTYTTLPVHNNIILVGESSEEDREENMMFFSSTSPRYPITAYRLALLIGESIQPSITLEVVTILLHSLLTHFENIVSTNKNLDVEFPSLKNSKRFHKTLHLISETQNMAPKPYKLKNRLYTSFQIIKYVKWYFQIKNLNVHLISDVSKMAT